MTRISGGVSFLAAVVLAAIAAGAIPQSRRGTPFGFTPSAVATQLALESRFLALPDASRIRAAHREITASPHPAGSPRDRELADWFAREFGAAGLTDVAIATHEVMLPRPLDVRVELTAPRRWRAKMREEPLAADPDTQIDPRIAGPPYHAFSASGDVTAAVVYAGEGGPAEYDWLAARGIEVRGRIVLVRYSTPYSYRGFKAHVAQQRGAAGILMYSDPAGDGTARGAAYPDGPWGPESRIERGAIAYDFLAPGDPLTPGWSSTAGARRLARRAAPSLPTIVSAPLSAADARPILEALGGPAAPAPWRGALPVKYAVGPGPATVRMVVKMDDGVGPIWTVTGMLRGSDPDGGLVIVGNHRDAWLYGGVDPSSGSAALLELARTFGALARGGWRPTRSILFASWDGEELAATSSTEWGEQHAALLRDRAVAYLNVDSAASGSRLVAAATPSLARLLAEAAEAVRDPASGATVAAVTRGRHAGERGVFASGTDEEIVDDRLGGGSDHTVFVNFLGIPSADLAFDGPYGVYHSLYDTHLWVSRIGDPGFRYHAALVRIWGLAALRLANADVLPLDPGASARRIASYVAAIARRVPAALRGPSFASVEAAAGELERAAGSFGRDRDLAVQREDGRRLATLNARLLGFERSFLDAEGLPGRPWYRHLIQAPAPTYEPLMLPGLSEAIDAGDARRFDLQCARLAAALGRAAGRLTGPPPRPPGR